MKGFYVHQDDFEDRAVRTKSLVIIEGSEKDTASFWKGTYDVNLLTVWVNFVM